MGRRFALMIVLLLAGAALLGWSIMRFLAPPAGWQAVQANGTGEASCAEDLTFLYEAGSSAEAKAAAARYTEACQRAYRLFQSHEEFEGVENVCTLNRRPNEVLTVDEWLYGALAAVTANGRRELYLGPVYARYGDLFFCQDDYQLAYYDPRTSEDVAREYRNVLAFANDPQAVDLELLGENRVCLRGSEEYLAYAEREGVERFIDFGWMSNAFIVDLVAGDLAAGGFVNGVLSSDDGFTRNLDSREGTYDYPLHQRQGGQALYRGNLQYAGPLSLVCLRDFPTSERDMARFYTLRDGQVRTVYLDAADALCKNAVSSLLCYSGEKSCGEILMAMLPVYVADALGDVSALAAEGIQAVWSEGDALFCTDPQAVLTDLAGGVEVVLQP